MNLKRITVLAASTVFAAAAMAQGGISVIVDGNPVTFHGVGPQEVNGRVLVPLRGVLEQMGAYVDWEPAGQLVTAQRGDTTIELRIGSTTARVNNSPVSLDVPAEIYRGNTMVPLRFMSEALGADVRWEPNQYAVVINTGSTSGARGQNYNPPLLAKAHIDSLTFDRTGWVSAGSQITFRMRGTPGGTASLTIPGVASNIPMDEVSPGEYELAWTVPDDRNRINVARLAPSVRLDVNNSERTFQYAPPVATGNEEPPIIGSLTPDDRATVTVRRPTISASFDDSVGSGIDPQSIRMTVDGRDVTPDASINSNEISYTPSVGFSPGRHDVRVTASDMSGNQVSKAWSFRVGADGGRTIRSFTVTGFDNARPGDVLEFTMMAAPGGQATFSIGDIIHDKPMVERNPGQYVGTYTLRRDDDLTDQPVTARFIARSGEVYTVNAKDHVDLNAPLDPPTLISPRADEAVDNPLVVEGNAPPDSRVHVHVDYSTNVGGATRMTGQVADVVVVADANGHFETDPIDLSTYIQGRDVRYVVTATTLGVRDRKSAPTSVTVSR